ncbi:UNKNOWN [Stylonychia lemnae]|uniref:UDENN domain-containing protein n=1 Tax=Stylonychia lemnae TaxID=5949 RepID=A0A078AR11_STYLE|nr:UNKNOWN [Stylonychia lemnae]|eukprot:CDW84381.1 UNKNOWN [Stylonychia lemnae]
MFMDQVQLERELMEEKFYNNLEESDTLVDYFCVIGLDQQRIAQLIHEKLPKEQIAIELSNMKPQLISKFPPKDKKSFKIDENVESELPNFAFPQGYRIIDRHDQPKQHQIACMFDGGLQKIFAQFFIFYEELDEYRLAHESYMSHFNERQGIDSQHQIRQGLSIFQDRETTAMTSITQLSRESNVETVENARNTGIFNDIPIIRERRPSDDRYEEEKKSHIESQKHHNSTSPTIRQDHLQPSQNGSNRGIHHQHTSPISQNHTFHEPWNQSQITSIAQHSHTPSMNQSSTDILNSSVNISRALNQGQSIFQSRQTRQSVPAKSHKIYIPKAICLLSRYPFYDYFSEILDDLYNASKHHVIDCPAPPRGLARVKYEKYSKQGKFLELTQPPINELPFVNRSFFDILFKTLPPELIITIFTHILVERPVNCCLLISIQILVVAQCQPWPYIIGILENDLEEALQMLNENNDKSKPLIIQISQMKVTQNSLNNEQIQQFKPTNTVLEDGGAQRNHVKAKNVLTAQLPQKPYNSLLQKVKTALKSENQNQMLSQNAINNIRNAFYQTLLELFAYYKEFVQRDQDGEIQFDIKRFIQFSNKQYKEFYLSFFQIITEKVDRLSNQLFMNFISQQSVNNYNNIQCSVMHFNESIQKLQDGETIAPFRRSLPFLVDKTQDIKETHIAPPVQFSKFSIQELKDSYLMNPDLPQLYPLEINLDEESNSGFRYLIFPILNQRLYESPKVFRIECLAANLERQLQTNWRTESRPQYKSLFQRQKINIPQVSKFEGTYVHITWIYVWCATLWMQDDREKFFRLMQVLQVVAKLKADFIQRPQLDLFFLLIETSFQYGNMKMTQKIYETLQKYDLKPDARIQQRYFQHLKITQKRQEKQAKISPKKTNNISTNNITFRKSDIVFGSKKESIINDRNQKLNQKDQQFLNPNSRFYRQVKYQQQFRQRTFKTKEDVNILFDEVKLKLQEQCNNCSGQLLAAQLRKAIEKQHMLSQRNGKPQVAALCTYCGREIETPQLKVTIGKRIRNIKGSFKEENTVFYNAAQVHRWFEILFIEADSMKIDMCKMRQENKNLFWNIIYYFNDYSLPFDFILPYEDTSEFDLDYEQLKNTAQLVKVLQVKNDIEEVLEDEKENDEEGAMTLGGNGMVHVGRFH